MEILLILGLITFLIYKLSSSPTPKPQILTSDARLSQRNQEWILFIAGYLNKVKSPIEKKLLQRMLDDIDEKGLATDVTRAKVLGTDLSQASAIVSRPSVSDAMEYEIAKVNEVETSYTEIKLTEHEPNVQLDNASLLLYFGAFLFVASVGLFIAFGGTNGGIRTLAVLVVMAVLYGGGQWLFHTKPKLEQAGLAFAGMGMAIAPLAGVAAYYYLFDQSHGPLIWMLTSLLCIGMYAHALISLKRPLISYLLIFTFLSLFESGVSIIEAPIYYFGWAMALTGIILTLLSRMKGFWPELQESSRASGALFLPLAVFASAILIGQHGVIQFGVSLLIAAAYYGLEALATKDDSQQTNAVVAQMAIISGIAVLTYGITNSWNAVTVSILISVAAQLILVMAAGSSVLMQNFASIMMFTAFISAFAGYQSPGLVTASVVVLCLSSVVTWFKQQRVDAFTVFALSWIALPLVIGQILLEPRMSGNMQTGLSATALVLFMVIYASEKLHNKIEGWPSAAQQLIVLSVGITMIVSFFASSWFCVFTAIGIAACLLLLAEYDHDADWGIVGGLIIAVPLIRVWENPAAMVGVNLIALIANMLIALRHRKEITRWFSTILWLLVPVTLADNFPGAWGSKEYAWGYVLVMIGLLISRSIARGVVFRSSAIPVASYARTASQSYVFGYVTAAILAITTALNSIDAQVHATLVLAFMAVAVFVIGKWVEKQRDVYFLLPLLAQAIVWSAMRPMAASAESFLLISVALAAVPYIFITSYKQEYNTLRLGLLASGFITPASLLIIGDTLWPMPLGLLVAGCMTYNEVRQTNQGNRELAASIAVLAGMWSMWYVDIHNLQAYTHVLAAMFAAYAYWRSLRGEREVSDQYLYAMLATATVPLALQAISGQAGGVYGWWLLLEQVGFMLLGMLIGCRFVTFWGLYVAIASVLYQLRHLGWAALTVLAMFLIGIAMYYLQKHSDGPTKN
jgi:hypothetical protein